MNNFQTLYASFSPDSHARGKQFEVICKWFLENDPHYANRLQKVWLWDDWPGRWGADCGIDLVAKDTDGKIWAIQAKCYDPSYSVTKHDVDKFLSESTNEKIDYRLLIATTDRMGDNSRKVIKRQNQVLPFNMLLLDDLEQAPLDWPPSVDELGSGGAAKKHPPRPHQLEAIEAATTKLVDRGQIIMACGTGKTLTGLWLAEKMESKRTLVLLPSLLLLSKTLADWVAQANEPFAYLPVCSDDTVSRNVDSVVTSTAELAFPSTTDADEIGAFLRKHGTRVVFSTYQSSPKIAEAFKQGDVPGFDLVIADEAHRCAGKVASEYGTVLDNDAIPAQKRLFMTATPRVYTPHLRKAAENSGFDVASMDDETVFGPVLHRLTFGQAIELDLLSDYQVVVVGIDDPAYHLMVDERRIVETESGITSDARTLASHIGLAKAMDRYNLRRVITFHSRVKWASQFAAELSEVVDWMPKQYRPEGELKCSFVSGDMSTSLRNQRLASMADVEPGQRAVLANARCLSEGVDVPALDGVAFIDPKKSEIDIVQAVGRAIRLSPDKLKGTIIIPVFISDGDDPDTVLSGSEFDKVWKVVNALRAHDDALGDELDSLRTQLGKRGSTERPSKIVLDVPIKVAAQFATAFDTRLVEATTASWHFWFGLLEVFTEGHKHSRVPDDFKTQGGHRLGRWVGRQRRAKPHLSREQIARFEALIGWTWSPHDALWQQGYDEITNFVKQEGHASVPYYFETNDGFRLGIWVQRQRAIKKDNLFPERIALLEALPGWTWNPLETQWQEGFSRLCAFAKKEGHALVPGRFVTADGYKLGFWVSNKRQNKVKLRTEQISALEALPGWEWSQFDSKWNQGFRILQAFVKEKRHARVPAKFKTTTGYRLGSWVANQRSKKDQLSDERIKKLEAMPGWEWEPLDSKWSLGFEHLEVFVKEQGHIRVPDNFIAKDGYRLRGWINSQRSNKAQLPSERISKLESLPGWEWDVQGGKWQRGFDYLAAFVDQKGHARVVKSTKTTDGYALGEWVGTQRRTREQLSIDKIAKLEALPGWTWDAFDAKWSEGYSYLEEFAEQEGHSRVEKKHITEDGFALGQWALEQRRRKDKLSSERIAQLEALPDWTWDLLEYKWKEGMRHLYSFIKQEGHALVPANFTTADGYALGAWVSQQRSRRNKSSQDRISKLEAIPEWVWDVLEAKWLEGFNHLLAFANEQGHTRVIQRYKTDDGYALGNWVSTQRRNKNRLSPEQQEKIESLPSWTWDARK